MLQLGTSRTLTAAHWDNACPKLSTVKLKLASWIFKYEEWLNLNMLNLNFSVLGPRFPTTRHSFVELWPWGPWGVRGPLLQSWPESYKKPTSTDPFCSPSSHNAIQNSKVKYLPQNLRPLTLCSRPHLHRKINLTSVEKLWRNPDSKNFQWGVVSGNTARCVSFRQVYPSVNCQLYMNNVCLCVKCIPDEQESKVTSTQVKPAMQFVLM